MIDLYANQTRQTAIYPDATTGSATAISYVLFGLGGEGGEIQNKWKKVLRDNEGLLNEDVRQKLIDEAGDVFWYLCRFCDELGVAPSLVLERNMQKLLSRKERGVLGGSGDSR